MRRGAIHFFRCLAVCLISPSTNIDSANRVSVRAAMAEIRRDRRFETGFVVGDDRAQPRQPVETLLERRRRLSTATGRTGGERRHPGRFGPGFSVAGPWRSPRRFLRTAPCGSCLVCPGSLAGKLGLYARSGKSAQSREGFAPKSSDLGDFSRHKILKSRLAALSKAGLRWYIPLAPQGIRQGLPSQEASGRTSRALARWPKTFRHSVFRQGAQWFIAGWSSPVARQAHNLKVIGSNPIPATKINLSKSMA